MIICALETHSTKALKKFEKMGVLKAGNRVAWGGFEGVLIVWGGEWGKWGGFGVIIRVKCVLQIVVGRVWRSYQQIVNNLWKMV